MNLTCKKLLLFLCVVMAFFCFGVEAFAEEGPGPGRRIWDNILLLVNFGILVFLFLKYAKKPLMDFLAGEREKIRGNLDTLNSRLNDVNSAMKTEAEKLKDIDKRIQEIREEIIRIGQNEKQMIIEQAMIKADKMVEGAKSEAGYKLVAAKRALNAEITDIAVSIVEKKLIKEISPDDNDELINQFVLSLDTSKHFFESE